MERFYDSGKSKVEQKRNLMIFSESMGPTGSKLC